MRIVNGLVSELVVSLKGHITFPIIWQCIVEHKA
jgi:hypothetical protein